MSYLDLPRLYFSGRFFANPSTINNKLANFSPDVKLLPLSTQRQSSSMLEEYAGFQYINPYGLHNFYLDDCFVTGLHAEDGTYEGMQRPLGSITSGTPYAKIVDLDPDQQSISQIFGLSIGLRLADGSGFEGRLEPMALFDLWYGRVPSVRGDQMAAGCFQSIIPAEKITWFGGSDPVIRQLRERCVAGISVKFMLDAYQGNPALPGFNYGRVVGIVGPGLSGEPVNFAADRRLIPRGSSYGPGYFKVAPKQRRLTIDLSNSATLVEPGGEAIAAGTLQAAILREDRLEPLGRPLQYDRAALTFAGGLTDLPVTPQQCALLKQHPLGILATHPGVPPSLLLQEHPSLKWINCEPSSLRLMPGEQGRVTFHARRAGEALCGQQIDLKITSHEVNNRPRSGIQFPSLVLTDQQGMAEVILQARTPQPLPPRRAVIDSQLYHIGGGDWQTAGELTRQSGGGVLSVLVFNDVAPIEAPTWNDHVGPILSNYARMYPGVAEVLGLHGYENVRANATRFLRLCLLSPREDPMHFPPSRDLSPDKARIICRWIDLGMPLE
jgi:hypothetical protein